MPHAQLIINNEKRNIRASGTNISGKLKNPKKDTVKYCRKTSLTMKPIDTTFFPMNRVTYPSWVNLYQT